MTTIALDAVGRKFNRDWILRHVDLRLEAGTVYVVTGPNGSGKSTFLQLIAGNLPHTEGNITYSVQGRATDGSSIFRHMAVAAPYLELIEELTLAEAVAFHMQFKPLRQGWSAQAFLRRIGLETARHKYIRDFSSGMKTRLKLGLACYSDTPILLLDEPTSNLDAAGIAWYQAVLAETLAGRLVVICSNQPYEYAGFTHILRLENGRLLR